MRPPTPTLFCCLTSLCLAAATATAREVPSSADSPPLLAPAVAAGGIRAQLSEPLVDRAADGALWVRTRDLRACFDGRALTVHPVLGKSAAREWPVRFELVSATVGEESLALTPPTAPRLEGAAVQVDRGAVREVHHLTLDGIEQTFVLDTLPSLTADLVLQLDVTTDLRVETGPDGALRFAHATLGHLDYGAAFLVDGAGRRAAIERVWTGGGIELRVPAALLAEATLPLTIDPLLTFFSSGFGVSDDARPDIAYCGVTDEYLVCWEEYTSAANSDVYVTKWNADLTVQGGAFAIEMGNDTWVAPRIAYVEVADRALVVATVNSNTGLANSSAGARLVDVGGFAPVGAAFDVSTIGATKLGVTVGGSNRTGASEGNFCVVWSQEVTPTNHNVRYRVLASDGSFLTGATTVDFTAADDVTPAIAKTLGAGASPDVFWTIAWVRDDDQDDVGQVYARRIAYDGDPFAGTGMFVVDSAPNCARPEVSTRLNSPLVLNGDRPSVVTYERVLNNVLVPGSLQGDIYATVVVDGQASLPNAITRMEGFDRQLDQRRPTVATNGRGVFLAYLEERYDAPGSGDWDVHMATGNITLAGTQGWLALAERHLTLAHTTLPELPVRITTRREGDLSDLSSFGAAIWARQSPGNTQGFGGLHGVGFSHEAATLFGPQAVGRQYCDAEPNSVGFFGGRTNSWLRIIGNQSRLSLHTAECLNMPSNAFGYLNVAPAAGNVLFPGGSQGRLCITGSIGRYVSQLQSSGGSGAISVTIDPLALPQPNGAVAAAAGQSWYFQVWHRDSVGGVATSNFSNACSVTFK